jgi:hypothetical protein
MGEPICPECRAGKHVNCTDWAIDDSDGLVACGCIHEPAHRWPSNEQAGVLSMNDVCLVCGVTRVSDDPYEIAVATSPCPGVPWHQAGAEDG